MSSFRFLLSSLFFAFLNDIEPAVAADLIDADEHAIAFAAGILVDLTFDDSLHDLLSQISFLIDGRGAIQAPAGACGGVILEHANMGIILQVGAARSQ